MYNLWEIADPKFAPARRNIQSITNAYPALVTTINPHGYVDGTVVRLVIPIQKGMQDANNLTGTISVTGNNTFTIDIDTTQMQPFITVVDPNISPLLDVCAQVQPVGESNKTLAAATQDTGRI
jgi:hypothetical protein